MAGRAGADSLDRLLATVVDASLAAMRDAAVAAGTCSPELWFGLLRALEAGEGSDAGVPLKDLTGRLAMSKRMVRHAVTVGVRHGFVAEEAKAVTITPAGVEARERWTNDVLADGQRRLTERIGPQAVDDLTARLGDVVGRFDLEWPHLPFTYGTADPSITGGVYRKGSTGPPRVPPSGQDWAPVIRTGPDTVAGLTTLALTSQALAAFHVDAFAEFGCILPISAVLAAAYPSGTSAAFDDVRAPLHLSGDGRSLLERHGFVAVRGTKGAEVATLTARGTTTRDAYAPVVAAVEDRWRQRHDDASVTALRSALEQATASVGGLLPMHDLALVRIIR